MKVAKYTTVPGRPLCKTAAHSARSPHASQPARDARNDSHTHQRREPLHLTKRQAAIRFLKCRRMRTDDSLSGASD